MNELTNGRGDVSVKHLYLPSLPGKSYLCQCLGFRIAQCSSLICPIFDCMSSWLLPRSIINAQNHSQWHQSNTEQTWCFSSSSSLQLGKAFTEDSMQTELPWKLQRWSSLAQQLPDRHHPVRVPLHTCNYFFFHLGDNQGHARPTTAAHLPVNTKLAFSSSSWGTLKLKDSL